MGEGGNISYSSEVSEAIIVCPLFTENGLLFFFFFFSFPQDIFKWSSSLIVLLV